MAVPATLSSVPNIDPYIQYVAASGQTVYPYPFPITQDSDLVVVINGVTQATDSGYSVSNVGNPTGGNVTLNSGSTAGDIITLYRDIPIERISQISQNSGFSSTVFNNEFNNFYLIAQQLEASIEQCLQIPNTNNPAPTTTLDPLAYANKYMAFDSNGNPEPGALTSSGSLTQSIIAGLLIPRTAAEIAAGITPTNYQYAPYTLLRYGADPTGTSDSSTALQNAITCAQQAGYSMVTVGVPGATLKIGSAWTINLNLTGIDFQGAYVDASAFSGTGWCTPTQTAGVSVNQRPMLNKAHPIKNAVWNGNNSSSSYALYLNEPVADNIAGVVVQNIGFQSWPNDVYFGAGAFFETFIACAFSSYGVILNSGWSITQSNATNGGERQTFIGCEWYNKPQLFSVAGNCDLYLMGCSLDYFNQAFNITGGNVFMFNGHIEASSDAANWGYVNSTNATLVLSGVNIIVTGNKSTYDLFYSSSSTTNGGVVISDCVFGPGSTVLTVNLIGGTGNARVSNLIQGNGGAKLPLSSSLNLLAYGGFESANYTAEWTLTANAVRSTAQHHSGSYSLSLPGDSSHNPNATAKFTCKPGQYFQGSFWYMFPSATSGTLLIELYYQDAGGNAIGSAVVIIDSGSAVNSWTYQNFASSTPAPAGTATVSFSASVIGASSGTQTAYLDDIIANVV